MTGERGRIMKMNLSERQEAIIQFIIDFVGENKYPPTIREIGEKVGISSTSVVNYNLKRLEELDLITRKREKSRGLSLNWDQVRAAGFTGKSETMAFPVEPSAAFRVPVLGGIAAGEPIQVEPSDPSTADEYIYVPETMLGDSAARFANELFALRVQGDSMVDASVLDGDIVILRHQERAENGEMVAAWIMGDDETTLKYWHLKDGQVRLVPANPTYAPIVREADKVRVQGRVVGVYRQLA